MSGIATENSPVGESWAEARRQRLFQLQRIVWELMFERFHGIIQQDHDGTEVADLIEALRVCSLYINQIECIGRFAPLIFRIEGTDSNEYLLGFDFAESSWRLNAARVQSNSLILGGAKWNQDNLKPTVYREQPGFVETISLKTATVDRAFLVGMSLVIELMAPQGHDEDERLMPLVKKITPTSAELTTISANRQTPIILLDDDDPY